MAWIGLSMPDTEGDKEQDAQQLVRAVEGSIDWLDDVYLECDVTEA